MTAMFTAMFASSALPVGAQAVAAGGFGATVTAAPAVGLGGILASAGSAALGVLSNPSALIGGALSIAAGVAVMGATQQSGNVVVQGLEMDALMESNKARAEVLEGRRQAVDDLRNLNETMANNIVAANASGITGEGSVRSAQLAAVKQGNYQLGLTRDNAEIAAASRRIQRRKLELAAAGTRASTKGSVISTGIKLVSDLV